MAKINNAGSAGEPRATSFRDYCVTRPIRNGKRGEAINIIAECGAADHIWSPEAFERLMEVAAVDDADLEREFRRLWNNYAYLVLDLSVEEARG